MGLTEGDVEAKRFLASGFEQAEWLAKKAALKNGREESFWEFNFPV